MGIEFKNERNVYPTVKAHSAIEYAKEDLGDGAKSNQIMEELYKRYFEQGQNINSFSLLVEVCGQFGVDDQEVVERVAEDQARCRQVS